MNYLMQLQFHILRFEVGGVFTYMLTFYTWCKLIVPETKSYPEGKSKITMKVGNMIRHVLARFTRRFKL